MRNERFINVLRSIADLDSLNDLRRALNFPDVCIDRFSFADAKVAYCNKHGFFSDRSTLEWIEAIYNSDLVFENCDEFRERYGLIKKCHAEIDWSPVQIVSSYISFFEDKHYDKEYPEQYHFLHQVFDAAKNHEEAFGKVSLVEFLRDHYLHE